MTNYTIIAYRPDYVDTCRGCVMGRTGSEMETGFFTDLATAAAHAAGFETREGEADPAYASWEITLLVDGLGENEWWHGRDWTETDLDPFEEFRSLTEAAIKAEAERRVMERKRLEEVAAVERKRKSAAAATAREAAERSQLRALMEKYPDEA
jgi:hypothetical protein